jgi:hypothetical protein
MQMIHNEDTRSLDGVVDFRAVISANGSAVEITHEHGTVEVLQYYNSDDCLKGFRVISDRLKGK